ncbi:hypothetical protein HDU89_005233 [Geranomyces variabilis]|nr:hypothetical protein HDU89_005233 [Geranomyces variabilis]
MRQIIFFLLAWTASCWAAHFELGRTYKHQCTFMHEPILLRMAQIAKASAHNVGDCITGEDCARQTNWIFTANFQITPYKENAEGSTNCSLEFINGVPTIEIQAGSETTAVTGKINFSRWFSFTMSSEGAVTAFFAPPDETPEAIMFKKGVANPFSAKIVEPGTGLRKRSFDTEEHDISGPHYATYTVSSNEDPHHVVYRKLSVPIRRDTDDDSKVTRVEEKVLIRNEHLGHIVSIEHQDEFSLAGSTYTGQSGMRRRDQDGSSPPSMLLAGRGSTTVTFQSQAPTSVEYAPPAILLSQPLSARPLPVVFSLDQAILQIDISMACFHHSIVNSYIVLSTGQQAKCFQDARKIITRLRQDDAKRALNYLIERYAPLPNGWVAHELAGEMCVGNAEIADSMLNGTIARMARVSPEQSEAMLNEGLKALFKCGVTTDFTISAVSQIVDSQTVRNQTVPSTSRDPAMLTLGHMSRFAGQAGNDPLADQLHNKIRGHLRQDVNATVYANEFVAQAAGNMHVGAFAASAQAAKHSNMLLALGNSQRPAAANILQNVLLPDASNPVVPITVYQHAAHALGTMEGEAVENALLSAIVNHHPKVSQAARHAYGLKQRSASIEEIVTGLGALQSIVDFDQKFGPDLVGVNVRAHAVNSISLDLSVIASHLAIDVDNVAGASLYVDIGGLQEMPIFGASLQFEADVGYDMDMLKGFKFSDVANIVSEFNKVKDSMVGDMKFAIQLAKDAWADVIAAIDYIKQIAGDLQAIDWSSLFSFIPIEDNDIKAVTDLLTETVDHLKATGESIKSIAVNTFDQVVANVTKGLEDVFGGLEFIAQCPQQSVTALIAGLEELESAFFAAENGFLALRDVLSPDLLVSSFPSLNEDFLDSLSGGNSTESRYFSEAITLYHNVTSYVSKAEADAHMYLTKFKTYYGGVGKAQKIMMTVFNTVFGPKFYVRFPAKIAAAADGTAKASGVQWSDASGLACEGVQVEGTFLAPIVCPLGGVFSIVDRTTFKISITETTLKSLKRRSPSIIKAFAPTANSYSLTAVGFTVAPPTSLLDIGSFKSSPASPSKKLARRDFAATQVCTVDEFETPASPMCGGGALPEQRKSIQLWKTTQFFLVGGLIPVSFSLEFDAIIGLSAGMKVCLMDLAVDPIITPVFAIVMSGTLALGIDGLLSAGLTAKGTVADTHVPIAGHFPLAKVPAGVCVNVGMNIVPLALTLLIKVEVLLIKYSAPLVTFSSDAISFEILNTCPAPGLTGKAGFLLDMTPPVFSAIDAYQVIGQAVDSPMVFARFVASDVESGLKSVTVSVGRSPGDGSITPPRVVPLGQGESITVVTPTDASLDEQTIYVSFLATNQQNLTTTSSVALLYDLSPPKIEITDDYSDVSAHRHPLTGDEPRSALRLSLAAYTLDLATQAGGASVLAFADHLCFSFLITDKTPQSLVQYAIGTGANTLNDTVPWTTVSNTQNRICEKGLNLTAGTYYASVFARNMLGFTSLGMSKGTVLDFSPPQPGELFFGTVPGQTSNGTEITNVAFITFRGFTDPESGSAWWRVAIGPSSVDAAAIAADPARWTVFGQWTQEKAFFNPPDIIPAPIDPVALPEGNHTVCVQAQNFVGLGTTTCRTGYIVDLSPPHGEGKIAAEGFTVTVSLSYKDNLSGVQHVWVALGDGEEPVYMDWQKFDLSIVTDISSVNFTVPDTLNGILAYGEILLMDYACNVFRSATTNFVQLDLLPPLPGLVYIGEFWKDVPYIDGSRLCVSFDEWQDTVSGVGSYDVSFGSSAGATDIFGWKTGIPPSTRQFCVDGITSVVDEQFVVANVRGWNLGRSLFSSASSSGTIVDMTPPEPFNATIVTSSGTDVTRDTAEVDISWDSTVDLQSGLVSYLVAIGKYVNGSPQPTALMPFGMLNPANPLATIATIYGADIEDGDIIFATVQATNGAGKSQTTTTQNVRVSTGRPKLLQAYFESSATAGSVVYVSSASTVAVRWNWENAEIFTCSVVAKSDGVPAPTVVSTAQSLGCFITALPTLLDGQVYTVVLGATTIAGVSEEVRKDFKVATKAPSFIDGGCGRDVANTGNLTASTFTRSARGWWNFDPGSAVIVGYNYAFGSAPGKIDLTGKLIQSQTSFAEFEPVIPLAINWTYFLSVSAFNEAGLSSDLIVLPVGTTIVAGAGAGIAAISNALPGVEVSYQETSAMIAATFSGFKGSTGYLGAHYEWIDSTPPVAGQVQFTNLVQSASTSSAQIRVDGFSDPESGLLSYWGKLSNSKSIAATDPTADSSWSLLSSLSTTTLSPQYVTLDLSQALAQGWTSMYYDIVVANHAYTVGAPNAGSLTYVTSLPLAIATQSPTASITAVTWTALKSTLGLNGNSSEVSVSWMANAIVAGVACVDVNLTYVSLVGTSATKTTRILGNVATGSAQFSIDSVAPGTTLKACVAASSNTVPAKTVSTCQLSAPITFAASFNGTACTKLSFQPNTFGVSVDWSGCAIPSSVQYVAAVVVNALQSYPIGSEIVPSSSRKWEFLNANALPGSYKACLIGYDAMNVTSAAFCSPPAILDYTPPVSLYAGGGFNPNAPVVSLSTSTTTSLIRWDAWSDPESSVNKVLLNLVDVTTSQAVASVNTSGSATSYLFTGLTLVVGDSYAVTVQAVNGVGQSSVKLQSAPMKILGLASSDGPSLSILNGLQAQGSSNYTFVPTPAGMNASIHAAWSGFSTHLAQLRAIYQVQLFTSGNAMVINAGVQNQQDYVINTPLAPGLYTLSVSLAEFDGPAQVVSISNVLIAPARSFISPPSSMSTCLASFSKSSSVFLTAAWTSAADPYGLMVSQSVAFSNIKNARELSGSGIVANNASMFNDTVIYEFGRPTALAQFAIQCARSAKDAYGQVYTATFPGTGPSGGVVGAETAAIPIVLTLSTWSLVSVPSGSADRSFFTDIMYPQNASFAIAFSSFPPLFVDGQAVSTLTYSIGSAASTSGTYDDLVPVTTVSLNSATRASSTYSVLLAGGYQNVIIFNPAEFQSFPSALTPVYACVNVTNIETGAITASCSTQIMYDVDPPTAGTVNIDGYISESGVTYLTSGNDLLLSWAGFLKQGWPDASSTGIASFEWALGSYPGGADYYPATAVSGSQTSAIASGMTLSLPGSSVATGVILFPGVPYICRLIATNNAGLVTVLSTDLSVGVPLAVDYLVNGLDPQNQRLYTTSLDSYTFSWSVRGTPARVLVAVGSSPGLHDVQAWTSISPLDTQYTAMFKSPVSDGFCVYGQLSVQDAVGTTHVIRSTPGLCVDVSAPITGTVAQGTHPFAHQRFTADTNAGTASWTGFYDPDSGISQYAWCIDVVATTGMGTCAVVAWTPTTLDTKIFAAPLTGGILADGGTYYLKVKATNGAGTSVVSSSPPWTVDKSAATGGKVLISYPSVDTSILKLSPTWNVGTGATQLHLDPSLIRIDWDGFGDKQSGVISYQIGLYPTSGEISPTTNQVITVPGVVTHWTFTGLSLNSSQGSNNEYYATVSAVNGAGVTSQISSSPFLVVDAPPTSGSVQITSIAADGTNLVLFVNGFDDANVDLDHYRVLVGLTPYGQDLQAQNVSPASFCTASPCTPIVQLNKALVSNTVVFVTVYVVNVAGLTSPPATSAGVPFYGSASGVIQSNTDFQWSVTPRFPAISFSPSATVTLTGYGLANFFTREDIAVPFQCAFISGSSSLQVTGSLVAGQSQNIPILNCPLPAALSSAVTDGGVFQLVVSAPDGTSSLPVNLIRREPVAVWTTDAKAGLAATTGSLARLSNSLHAISWSTSVNTIAFVTLYIGATPIARFPRDAGVALVATPGSVLGSTLAYKLCPSFTGLDDASACATVGTVSVRLGAPVLASGVDSGDETILETAVRLNPTGGALLNSAQYAASGQSLTADWTGSFAGASSKSLSSFAVFLSHDPGALEAGVVPTVVAGNVFSATLTTGSSLELGATYYANVIVQDETGLQLTAWSTPFIADTTAPLSGNVYFGRPSQVEDTTWQSQGNYALVYWSNFVDPESGLAKFQIQICSDVTPCSNVGQDVGSVAQANVTLPAGSVFTAKVRALNGVGTWGEWVSSRTALRVDSTGSPLFQYAYFAGNTSDVAPAGPSQASGLRLVWGAKAGSPIVEYRVMIGTTPNSGAQGGTYTGGLLIDLTPPVVNGSVVSMGGAPYLQSLPKTDTTGEVTVTADWTGVFSDPESGIIGFEFAVGTAGTPTQFTNQQYMPRGLATTGVVTITVPDGTLLVVTVRATNAAWLVTTAMSNPTLVGKAPPLAFSVTLQNADPPVASIPGVTVASSIARFSFDGLGDTQSGLADVQVLLSAADSLTPLLNTPIGVKSGLELCADPSWLQRPLTLTATAINNFGLKTNATSLVFKLNSGVAI